MKSLMEFVTERPELKDLDKAEQKRLYNEYVAEFKEALAMSY